MKQFEVQTDHIPTREEVIEWKKNQLRESFGTELFNRLYEEATSFFNQNKKQILRNKPIK